LSTRHSTVYDCQKSKKVSPENEIQLGYLRDAWVSEQMQKTTQPSLWEQWVVPAAEQRKHYLWMACKQMQNSDD